VPIADCTQWERAGTPHGKTHDPATSAAMHVRRVRPAPRLDLLLWAAFKCQFRTVKTSVEFHEEMGAFPKCVKQYPANDAEGVERPKGKGYGHECAVKSGQLGARYCEA